MTVPSTADVAPTEESLHRELADLRTALHDAAAVDDLEALAGQLRSALDVIERHLGSSTS